MYSGSPKIDPIIWASVAFFSLGYNKLEDIRNSVRYREDIAKSAINEAKRFQKRYFWISTFFLGFNKGEASKKQTRRAIVIIP